MSSKDSYKRDIFISFSSANLKKAEAIRDELRKNNFSCWMSEGEVPASENYSEEIMKYIKVAKAVVLVFSKEANDSPHVLNEVNIAFHNNDTTIIPYKIDKSFPTGDMEFYLKNKQWIDSSDDYRDGFDDLIETVNRVLKENKPKFDFRIPIIIAAVALIVIGGIMAFNGSDDVDIDTGNSSEITIDMVELVDDTDNGYSWKYSYTIVGSIPSNLNNSSKDVVHADFYDASGKVVESDESKVSEVEEGNILGLAFVDDNNIKKVHVELQDSKGNVISSAESSDIE